MPALQNSLPPVPSIPWNHAEADTATNQNLCDFFIQELAGTLASSDAILASVDAIENWMPSHHSALRSALGEVAKTARRCRNDLSSMLDDHGINLFATANPAIVALLESLSPAHRENLFEPWGVFGTRMISVFRKASLQMELQTAEMSEYAFLLGSDTLLEPLREQAKKWSACAALLNAKKISFCAEAYMGGAHKASHQPASKQNHNLQPKSPCYAG